MIENMLKGFGKNQHIPGMGLIEKFFRQFIRFGYVFGIALMIMSLPHSKFMMSLSQFILTGAFVLERFDLHKVQVFYRREGVLYKIFTTIPFLFYLLFKSIVAKFRIFLKNTPALVFTSILLMHVAGLIITTDFEYAFKDLRTKLPLLLLPLFISTTYPFSRKQFNWLLLLFIASVLVRTFINSCNLVEENFIDIRDISKPISHIIVSLLIVMSIFMLGNFVTRRRIFPLWLKIIFSLIIIWFVIYLIISKSGTGLAVAGLTLMIMLMIMLFTVKNEILKIGFLAFLIVSIIGSIVYYSNVYHDYYTVNKIDFSKLEKITPSGNPYIHDTVSKQTENGNYVYIYIQWNELKDEWNKRSEISFDSIDRRNQPLVGTLLRFLSSKGLKKDAGGVKALSDEEVNAIENGAANVLFTDSFSIRGLMYELLWGVDEYHLTGNPTGSSLMQRLEFWKASNGIIKENWITGVGTGDMNKAFQRQYEKMRTKLPEDQRWRSHNQFLSIFIGFGVFGLLWFSFAIIYPPYKQDKFRDYFFLIFFIIAMISMIPEDTIETQAGVTFFAFFYAFFLFGRNEEANV